MRISVLLLLFLSTFCHAQLRVITGVARASAPPEEQPFSPSDTSPDFWLDWDGPHVSTIDNIGRIVDNITSRDATAYVSVAESAGVITKKPSRNGEGLYFNELTAFRMGSNTTFKNLNNGTAWTMYISFKYLAQSQATSLRKIISTNSNATTNSGNVGVMVANLNSSADPHTLRCAITNSGGGATGPFDVTCPDNTLIPNEYNELKITFTGTSLTVYIRNSANATFTQVGQDNTGSGLSSANTTSELVFGVNGFGVSGYLKHVAFWYRALTSPETTDMELWLAAQTAQQITPTPVDVHLAWGQSNCNPGSGTDNATLGGTYPELVTPISNAYCYVPVQSGSAFTNHLNYWEQVQYDRITSDPLKHNWTLRMAYLMSQAGQEPYIIMAGRGSTGLLDKTGSIDWYADGGVATTGDMYPNFKLQIQDGLLELLHVMRKTPIIKSCGQYQGENDTSDPAATSPAYKLANDNFIKSLIPFLNGLGASTNQMDYYLFHPIFSGTKAADVIGDQAALMAYFKVNSPTYSIGRMKNFVTTSYDFAANHVTNVGASQAGTDAFNWLATATASNIQNITITVNPAQYQGTNVEITANANGATVTSWKWRIIYRYSNSSGVEDTLMRATSTSQNPSFSLDSLGFYDIQLTARNGTDKYFTYQVSKFVFQQARFTEAEADIVVNMSAGSQYLDYHLTDMSDKKIYLKGQTTNGYLEIRDMHARARHPARIQKANDNTQVTIEFSGGTGNPFKFSRYATGEGARYVIVNGFNLDGTPGIKVTAGAVSAVTVRVEGKLTDVAFYGIEVVSDPLNIDGAAIAVVPTVASDCRKDNWACNNIHVFGCKLLAGEEGVYINESNQSSGYVGNNGFNPPSGYGIVVARNTILGAGRDGIQVGSAGGRINNNFIYDIGQQHDSGGQESFIVLNSGWFGNVLENYGHNGEMAINQASGEYAYSPSTPDGRGAGQSTPQPTIVESNVFVSGTYGAGGTDETHFIYIQNNPNSGAGNWKLTFKNNILDTDIKCAEMLLALGGYTSQDFTFANNICIKNGSAGDTPEFNVTGNGKATLQGGTKTVNNLVRDRGTDLSDLYFNDYSTGDLSITSTLSAAYSGTPTTITVSSDFYGYPIPIPAGYFFGAYSNYNIRTITP